MELHVALFGFGSVGRASANYLLSDQKNVKNNTLQLISLDAIYSRSPKKMREAGLDPRLIIDNWQKIIDKPSINCIIELMGGLEFPKQIITAALKAKKHVVTANKALLAHHGQELFNLARANNVSLAFEASCGGGIPIINAITEGLSANIHKAIYGVMNGTCNFILTHMNNTQCSFERALQLAKELGLAEADPSLDIGGFDAGHKIAILASLAYKIPIHFESIPIKGISEVQNKDILFGKKLNYTIKLIAAAIKNNSSISIWVHPAFLPERHPMTYVEGSFNAISTIGDEVGHTFYYGRGAGGRPTNSAVISDLISIANGSYPLIFNKFIQEFSLQKPYLLIQSGIEELKTSHYIRVQVDDKPGTLTKISAIFAENNISIYRVLQEHVQVDNLSISRHTNYDSIAQSPGEINKAELIIITHASTFANVTKACKEISILNIVKDTPSLYPIIEIPQDNL